MRGGWRAAATLGGLVLLAAACTPPTATNTTTSPPASTPAGNPTTAPAASPSPSTSPSSSPSAEPQIPAVAITSLPVHNGEVGIGYLAVTLQATGGSGGYKWSLASGTFPPGLTLSSDGVITGKNTTAGKFNFTVKVADSAGQTDTGSTSMLVYSAFTVSQTCATVCNVGYQCTTCGKFGTPSGGLGPYTYKIVAGSVPTSMSWSGLSLSGPFPYLPSGPPAYAINPVLVSPQAWTLTVQVSDRFGATKNVKANWNVFGPIGWYSSGVDFSVYIGCYGQGALDCSGTTAYVLGSPSDSVTVKVVAVTDQAGNPTSLPPVWRATAKDGVVTVTAACDSTCDSWFGTVSIALVDNGACVAPSYKTTFLAIPVYVELGTAP